MTFERRTVCSTAQFEGLGLHSGEPVTVRVHPGGDGIAFRLGSERVPALPENVSDTFRCTRLGPVSVIEHLLAALAGLEITDAEIETYIATRKWEGCSGAYAIEFPHDPILSVVEGTTSNVIGLPMESLERALILLGALR